MQVGVQVGSRPGRSFAARLRAIAGPASRRVVLNERTRGGHATPEGELWPVWLDFLIAERMEIADPSPFRGANGLWAALGRKLARQCRAARAWRATCA